MALLVNDSLLVGLRTHWYWCPKWHRRHCHYSVVSFTVHCSSVIFLLLVPSVPAKRRKVKASGPLGLRIVENCQIGIKPNSTWLVTSHLEETMQFGCVELVNSTAQLARHDELGWGNSSDKFRHPRSDATDLVWRRLSALLPQLARHSSSRHDRHVDRVMSRQDVTSQVEFGLYLSSPALLPGNVI